MHGGDEPVESYTQELIEMLECNDPAHSDCREKAQAFFERLPRRGKNYIRAILDGKEVARRADREWERRQAAGMTPGGEPFRAMVDEILREYVPK